MSALVLARIPQEAGLCLTAQIGGSARKLDAYIAIARLRGADKFIRELDALAKATAALAERRNRVVHDPWFFFADRKLTGRLEVTSRRPLRHEYVKVSKDELIRLLNDIAPHLARFVVLNNQIQGAVGT